MRRPWVSRKGRPLGQAEGGARRCENPWGKLQLPQRAGVNWQVEEVAAAAKDATQVEGGQGGTAIAPAPLCPPPVSHLPVG